MFCEKKKNDAQSAYQSRHSAQLHHFHLRITNLTDIVFKEEEVKLLENGL